MYYKVKVSQQTRKMNLIPLLLILVLFKTAYVHADEMRNDDSSDNKADCEKGWDKFGDHCYKLEPESLFTDLSWTGASARCSELGGELASIHSKEENEFLTNTYAKKRGMYVWIGLHASGDLSTYQWNDGSPNDFENWAWGQPMHYGIDDISCIILPDHELFGEPGQWVAWRCGNFAALICKKMSYVHSDEMRNDDSSDNKADCEKGWDKFGDHCYKLEPEALDTDLSWTGASARCSELGGELASIHSKEENEFLTNTYAKKSGLYVWIGLHASGDLSTYQWNDGSPNDFQNWALDEPLHYGNDDIPCYVLTDDDLFGEPGQWITWRCDSFEAFICKKMFSMKTTTHGNQEEITSSISMKTTTPGNQEEITSSSNTSKHAFLTAVPYLFALFLILLVITIAHVSRKSMKHKRHQCPVYKKFRESKHSNDARRPDVI